MAATKVQCSLIGSNFAFHTMGWIRTASLPLIKAARDCLPCDPQQRNLQVSHVVCKNLASQTSTKNLQE